MASNPVLMDRRLELRNRLADLPAADRVSRFAFAAELANLYSREPEVVRDILETWQFWWRDLLMCRLGLRDLVINVDLEDRIDKISSSYPVEKLGSMVSAIQATISMLSQNINPRLSLEVLMLNVPGGPE